MTSPVIEQKLPTAVKLSPDVALIAVETAQRMGLSHRAAIEGIVRTCWHLYQTGQYPNNQTSQETQQE